MGDPYLDFNEDNDLSNIQVNLFRVKGPLRTIDMEERVKYIYNDVTIFNPEDYNNPSIKGIKLQKKRRRINFNH